MSYSPLLEIQIRTQKQNLWISVGWAILLFLIGVIGSIIWFRFDTNPDNKSLDILKLGPFFVTAAVSSFPINRVLRCRVSINYFVHVKYCFDNPSCLPPDQMQQLIDAVVDAIKDGLKVKE
jgi:hypothetical protein